MAWHDRLRPRIWHLERERERIKENSYGECDAHTWAELWYTLFLFTFDTVLIHSKLCQIMMIENCMKCVLNGVKRYTNVSKTIVFLVTLNCKTLLWYCKFILCGNFDVQNQDYHLQRGHGVPSKVEGRGIIATQPVLFNSKSTKTMFFVVAVISFCDYSCRGPL